MALGFTQLATGLQSTANQATAYTALAGTPVIGDLLIAAVSCSGNTAVGTVTGGGWTWRLISSFSRLVGSDIISIWYAYAATATSTAVSYLPASAATGCIIHTVRVTGAEGQQQPYIRQSALNTGTTANPTVVFPSPVLTGNGVLAWGANSTNNAAQWTAPTGFTEIAELAINTPTNSLEIARVISGVTPTTLTWTNVNTTRWATYAIEFYVAGTGPTEAQGISDGSGFFGEFVP